MKRSLLALAILVAILLLVHNLDAQCAMCSKTAMDGMKDGQTTSAKLNAGILYLLATPYALAIIIGGTWWYRRKKMLQQEA